MSAPSPSEALRGRAIASPVIDLLCVGGASMLVIAPLLLFRRAPLAGAEHARLLVLGGILINWPHFIASYRLLYASARSALAYPRASIYFPSALALYGVAAVCLSSRTALPVNALVFVSSLYLARHYTGQAWGMMAAFAHVTGVSFAARERRLVRLSLDLMMGWHLVWAATQTIGLVAPSLQPALAAIYARMDWVAGLSLVLGLYGISSLARRIGRVPPVRVIVPWAALYLWYALLRQDPSALLLVQLAHALQYLIFPLRVETNRSGRASFKTVVASLGSSTAIGLAVFGGLATLFAVAYARAGGQGRLDADVSTVIVTSVNIHHYFIDGALWKLRNPEVQKDVFAHLTPLSPAGAGVG